MVSVAQVAEVGSLVDLTLASLTAAGLVAEQAAMSDDEAASIVAQVALAESVAPGEVVDGAINSGLLFVSVTESGSIQDIVSVVQYPVDPSGRYKIDAGSNVYLIRQVPRRFVIKR